MLVWAHDARNPLSALVTNLHHVREALAAQGDPDASEAAAECLALCTVMERYVANLEVLLDGRGPRSDSLVRLRDVAGEVARRVAPYAAVVGQTVEVTASGDVDPLVLGDASYLRIALENLVASAIETSPPGLVQILVEVRNGEGVLAIVDRGAPWAADHASVFDVDAAGERGVRPSRGLSLPSAATAARAAGFRIAIERAEGDAALRVALVAPLAPPPPAPRPT